MKNKEKETSKKQNKAEKSNSDKKLTKKELIHSDVKKNVVAILFVVFSLLFLLSLIDQAGVAGGYINRILGVVFGWSKFLLPVLLLVLGFVYFRRYDKYRYYLTTIGVLIFLIFGTAILHSFFELDKMQEVAQAGRGGGFVGFATAYVLIKYLGILAALIVSGGFFLIGLILTFNFPLNQLLDKIKNWFLGLKEQLQVFSFSTNSQKASRKEEEDNIKEGSIKFSDETGDLPKGEKVEQEEITDEPKKSSLKNKKKKKSGSWRLPPLKILKKSKKREEPKDLDEQAERIVKTLADFGIEVYFKGYNIGPSMVQYTFETNRGTRLNKIVALQNNLAMALATSSIRIEAPIPGKSLIGVELPLPQNFKEEVRVKSIFESADFQESESNLTIALGQDVYGDFVLADIQKMPHLMVAGTTGSGKSICINTILASLLYQNSPEELKLLLIDPKRVELNYYNDIPHLASPVIVDPPKVIKSLQWAVNEMEARYKTLEKNHVNSIEAYNEKVKKGGKVKVEDEETGKRIYQDLEKMPYVVIIIDELNDLMMSCGKGLEELVAKVVHKARAVGLHVIISTQKPTVEVITGLIKANIPARIALKVATQIDSRTILDKNGADTLLGSGDMLFSDGSSDKLKRIQGAYISQNEIEKIVKYIREEADRKKFDDNDSTSESLHEFLDQPEGQQSSLFPGTGGAENERDELFEESKQLAISSGGLSASFLQTRMRIGFQRATRIIDDLERAGVLGPKNGSKPRELLIGEEEGEND